MDKKPHYLGHRQRLRERFNRAGLKGMNEHEVLELLLTFAVPRPDVKTRAKDLLNHFGSLSGVLDADFHELEKIQGIGPISSTLIRLVKEICAVYLAEKMKKKDVLSSPQAVLGFARMKLAGSPREAFMVIFVNAKNKVLDFNIVQEGTIDRAAIYPRKIIELAFTHNAAGIILVHNHPSGDCTPSPEDRQLTRTLAEAARTIDLRLLDHIIVGKEGYWSFREKGIL